MRDIILSYISQIRSYNTVLIWLSQRNRYRQTEVAFKFTLEYDKRRLLLGVKQ